MVARHASTIAYLPCQWRPDWRRFVLSGLVLVLAVTLLGQLPMFPVHAANGLPHAKKVKPVAGGKYVPPAPPADPTASAKMKAPRPVVWPTSGSVEVPLTRQPNERALGEAGAPVNRAGELPVWVGAKRGGVSKATVTSFDPELARRVGLNGLLLRVGRADGVAAGGRVSLRVNYAGFRDAYGGDWSSRLRMVRVPACALSTPDAAGCQIQPLASSNDLAASAVEADVDVPAAPLSDSGLRPQHTAGSLVALTAAP